jgi:hypothetical protein
MPRFLFVLAVVVGAQWLGAETAHAYYDGRWCAVVTQGRGSVREICHFKDFESCRLEATSGGNRGFCSPNRYWRGEQASVVPRKSSRKRAKSH